MILNVSKLTKSYGERVLFSDGSFSVEKGDIVGLIGANGVGKTTLFNIIIGTEESDSGSVLLLSGARVGYLEQHVCLDSDKTCYEETLTVFSHLFEIEEEQKSIEERLRALSEMETADGTTEEIKKETEKKADEEERQSLILKQAKLIEEYENLGGLTYVSRTHAVLSGLGFTDEEQRLPVSGLSGGQKSKIGLAKLLLTKPDIMLLDEPTNHLDIKSVQWLERFITGSKITALVISHDRYFLDRICTGIVEIYARKMFATAGNYTRHMELRSERDKTESRHYENTMAEVKRIEGIIEQQRRWNREKNIKTAESKQKQIDRMLDGLSAPEHENNDFRFSFMPLTESGEDVLSVTDLKMEFPGKLLYEKVSFDVKKGDSVFIVGENGIGKTTLIKQIMRRGRGVRFGVGVTIGYFDQHQLNLTLSKRITDEIHDAFPSLTDTEVRSALAVFGFRGEKVFDTLEVISGGERAKVALCKIMLKKCNFLILDEPTNHLDIYSMDALENALMSYTGTLLVISHDRYFINKLANKVLELKSDGARVVPGNYENYEELLLREAEASSSEVKASVKKEPGHGGQSYLEKKQRRSELTKLRTALRKTEEEIEKLENEINDTETALADDKIAADYERISELSDRLAIANTALDAAMEKWEELSLKVSEADAGQ